MVRDSNVKKLKLFQVRGNLHIYHAYIAESYPPNDPDLDGVDQEVQGGGGGVGGKGSVSLIKSNDEIKHESCF